MEKWIYKITNTNNGKIYIGQSTNPFIRFQQHIYESTREGAKGLHAAMLKYGIDSFKMEVIEGPIENYNERECYWIAYYDSYRQGYNLTEGGENPPIKMGEESTLSKFTDEEILKILETLRDTDKKYSEISEIFGITVGHIQNLNKGDSRKNPNFSYPIRKQPNSHLENQKIDLIIADLMETMKSTEQIARDHDVASSTVFYINKGIRNKRDNILYPIRKDGERISQKLLASILGDILNANLKFSSIEQKYGLSKSTINRINNGKTYQRDYLTYPIRNSKQRVYSENL